MKLFEKLGLIPISTSAERVNKLKKVYEGREKTYELKIKRLQDKNMLLKQQRDVLREKLYKANKWQIHVEVKQEELKHTNLSTLLERELRNKVDKPFTFVDITEFTMIGQEGKIRVYVNNDKDDSVYLYFSYSLN